MKSVTAIIRPTKLVAVKDGLRLVGIEMLTVTRVMGCGRRSDSGSRSADIPGEENLLNKTRLEIMVADHLVKKAVEAIEDSESGLSRRDIECPYTEISYKQIR